MKSASPRALQRYQACVEDAELLLPKSGAEPVLGQIDAADPFPNLVYKVPELDQGRGVYFLKAESPDHAKGILMDARRSSTSGGLQVRPQKFMSNRGGLYQAYYKSKMRPDRCLYIRSQTRSGRPVPPERGLPSPDHIVGGDGDFIGDRHDVPVRTVKSLAQVNPPPQWRLRRRGKSAPRARIADNGSKAVATGEEINHG